MSLHSEHSVPASHALQLVHLIARWNLSAETLLEPFGLTREELEDPFGRLPVRTLGALMQRTRALTGEPGIGVYLALQKRATLYGHVGLASMHAATLGEALRLAVQYTPAVTTIWGLDLQVEGDNAALVLTENADLGPARDVMLLSFLLGLKTIGDGLTGRSERQLSGWLHLNLPEPDYFRRFEELVPFVVFAQPANQLIFPARALELPLKAADEAAVRLAREHCERYLLALGAGEGLTARIRRAMSAARPAWSLDDVAATLATSPRTLKRHLAEHGVTFSELRRRVRFERAMLLLRSPEMSLDELSDRLGYASTSSFVRAFRRWTGKTPMAYRRDLARPSSTPPQPN